MTEKSVHAPQNIHNYSPKLAHTSVAGGYIKAPSTPGSPALNIENVQNLIDPSTKKP